jgi:hypothetical protein
MLGTVRITATGFDASRSRGILEDVIDSTAGHAFAESGNKKHVSVNVTAFHHVRRESTLLIEQDVRV